MGRGAGRRGDESSSIEIMAAWDASCMPEISYVETDHDIQATLLEYSFYSVCVVQFSSRNGRYSDCAFSFLFCCFPHLTEANL
jgi:hypothetical protein